MGIGRVLQAGKVAAQVKRATGTPGAPAIPALGAKKPMGGGGMGAPAIPKPMPKPAAGRPRMSGGRMGIGGGKPRMPRKMGGF